MSEVESDSPMAARFVVVLVGLAMAVATGMAIGSDDLFLGLGLVLVGGAILYLLVIRKLSWQIGLALCFLDFSFQPLGFRFGALELSCMLGYALVIAHIWQKRSDTTHPFFRTSSFRLFRLSLSIWIFYALTRFGWNHVKPFLPGEYAFSNAIKAESWATGLIIFMWLFSYRPRDITVKSAYNQVIALLLLLGLLVNIILRLTGIKEGVFADESSIDSPPSVIAIPVLNMTESLYTLRFFGPLSSLVGTVYFTSSQIYARRLWMRVVSIVLAIGGVFGSAISGGRSSVLVAAGFCVLVFVIRRKFLGLALAALMAAAGLCVLNVFSRQIVEDPELAVVQRSFVWAMMDQAQRGEDSIDSSTRWRQMLFNRAIDEWRSNPIIFWFGRGTYKYTDVDRLAIQLDPFQSSIDVSLRRAATHNLITDLLVMYGLVGLTLYLLVCLALIRLCCKFVTDAQLPQDCKDLALISAISSFYSLGYGLAAGGFIPDYLGWFVVLLLARIAQQSAPTKIEGGPVTTHSLTSAR
jgi:O-antigen ligase